MRQEQESSTGGAQLSPEALQRLTSASLKASPAAASLAASSGLGVAMPQQALKASMAESLLRGRLDAAEKAVPELTEAEAQFLEKHNLAPTNFLKESAGLRQALEAELKQCRTEYAALTPPDDLVEQWRTDIPSGSTGDEYLTMKLLEWRTQNAPTQLVERLNTVVADSNLLRGLEKRYTETVRGTRSRAFGVLRADDKIRG